MSKIFFSTLAFSLLFATESIGFSATSSHSRSSNTDPSAEISNLKARISNLKAHSKSTAFKKLTSELQTDQMEKHNELQVLNKSIKDYNIALKTGNTELSHAAMTYENRVLAAYNKDATKIRESEREIKRIKEKLS